ncbi:uncharacterized protein LOC142632775 [Castanea sativa]|uniref:uncharacterized protein LOC142632775 n=1 Tax=Castanea sativa TaxID=21020 RepID=UPI003F64B4C1
MKGITNQCASLKLSEREGNEVDLAPTMRKHGCVLAGKFYTKRRVNLELVARVLKTVWRTKDNFEVYDMGDSKAIFHFSHKEDLNKVLLLGPWSFDKYLLILHKLEAGEAATKVEFNRATFWVQIHGLPTMCQTKDAGFQIGRTLGKVERVDVDDDGFRLGGYMCIRVSMDIFVPLCRGRLVRLGGLSPQWVDFKYECFLIFCYWCGMVDHDERDCIQWMRSGETLRAEEKQYGPWLRATPKRLQKPQLRVAIKGDGGGKKPQRN